MVRVRAYLGGGLGHKRLVKFEHGELGRVPKLVAELAVPLHPQNLEIDIAPCSKSPLAQITTIKAT